MAGRRFLAPSYAAAPRGGRGRGRRRLRGTRLSAHARHGTVGRSDSRASPSVVPAEARVVVGAGGGWRLSPPWRIGAVRLVRGAPRARVWGRERPPPAHKEDNRGCQPRPAPPLHSRGQLVGDGGRPAAPTATTKTAHTSWRHVGGAPWVRTRRKPMAAARPVTRRTGRVTTQAAMVIAARYWPFTDISVGAPSLTTDNVNKIARGKIG